MTLHRHVLLQPLLESEPGSGIKHLKQRWQPSHQKKTECPSLCGRMGDGSPGGRLKHLILGVFLSLHCSGPDASLNVSRVECFLEHPPFVGSPSSVGGHPTKEGGVMYKRCYRTTRSKNQALWNWNGTGNRVHCVLWEEGRNLGAFEKSRIWKCFKEENKRTVGMAQ